MGANEYKAAKKLGEDAVRQAIKNGKSPYLPVLDSFDEIKNSPGEVSLGLLELPMDRITGNKTLSRNNAFANNFMPLFDEDSEFYVKWINLYDSYAKEGIRDAISCYEYMNNYYILEGNKRVSVSKFGGSEYILADVIRILPEKNDTKEVRVYYEYVDFYNVTKNFYIILSEPGEYEKLAELLGQNLKDRWPEQLSADLKSSYLRFCKACRTVFKQIDNAILGEAFLVYISIFPMKTLLDMTDDQIVKNVKMARNELTAGRDPENIAFVEAPPEGEKTNRILSLFSGAKKYTASSPLKVAFIYDAGVDDSRWIDSHEAGRLYVDEMTGDNVVTNCYYAEGRGGSISDALKKAIDDKNEVIFTVSPYMMSDAVKGAVANHEVKFLNCSIGQTQPSVRSYCGKLYEASFLMGILAASTELQKKECSHRIGYHASLKSAACIANINAFAIGAALIDPACRISLKWQECENDADYRRIWEKEGVTVFSDAEYTDTADPLKRPGVFSVEDGNDVYLGAPYFSWGKYYAQIVQSVLGGTWDAGVIIENHSATNYWFGLSTGVVDIRIGNIPYQTKKLLSFFKGALADGVIDPFAGDIYSTGGQVQNNGNVKKSEVAVPKTKMKNDRILSMDWLNDNVDGIIPDSKDGVH